MKLVTHRQRATRCDLSPEMTLPQGHVAPAARQGGRKWTSREQGSDKKKSSSSSSSSETMRLENLSTWQTSYEEQQLKLNDHPHPTDENQKLIKEEENSAGRSN